MNACQMRGWQARAVAPTAWGAPGPARPKSPGRPPAVAQVVGVHGHLAPKEHGQPHVVAALLKELAGLGKELGVAGEEQHGHAVVALVGQEAPALLGLLAEEPVGRLEEDARAVARVGLQAGAPAVVHVE